MTNLEERIGTLKEAYVNGSGVIIKYPGGGKITIDNSALPFVIEILMEANKR